MRNAQPKTAHELKHRAFARDFAVEARLAGEGNVSADEDARALRSISAPMRRALYEHVIRTALAPSSEADDAAILTLGVDPIIGMRLVRFLRRWVLEGPDGLEG